MHCLTLIGLLALATPESHARIPGTRLRLGMLESQLVALGAFAEVKVADAGGMATRQGPTRFFGVPGEGTLYLKDGRLARMRFEAPEVSRHSMDYVEDQLRRLGMVRNCEPQGSGDQVCHWTNAPVTVRLQYGKEKLAARLEPPAPAGSASAGATRSTKPGGSATGKTTKTPSKPMVVPIGPITTSSSAPPGSAPEPSGSAAGAATGSASSPPAALPGSGVPSTVAVATLPETLTIPLTPTKAPDAWPRILSSPPLEYPETARRESVQGIVWVLADVDPDGTVRRAVVERGIGELNNAAIVWVTSSRFAPCQREGAPCRFRVRVPVRFTLF